MLLNVLQYVPFEREKHKTHDTIFESLIKLEAVVFKIMKKKHDLLLQKGNKDVRKRFNL